MYFVFIWWWELNKFCVFVLYVYEWCVGVFLLVVFFWCVSGVYDCILRGYYCLACDRVGDL